MLSACSSVPEEPHSEVNISTSDTDIFVAPSISRSMGSSDRLKLQSLVATAQPQQWTKWVSSATGARFEFTSLSIYVNAQGQGCRNYKMAMRHGFLVHHTFNYTACRDGQGAWQVLKSKS
ncbi:17 kDa surface antigen [Candidatus Rickettsiella viridis]|uniref:17 kDa surface antigen n=2 Tax=Candidatus Rickettsiella viridis TaxID=676208 RepID=A0A2Z5UVH7_9COXI|nr:17 kDa surface antigen [Candidatus Rickettsiella viridis]